MSYAPEVESMEIPFQWHCPKCGHHNHDSVNPVVGPFVTVTCSNCNAGMAASDLSPEDQASFNAAVDAAEAIATKDT
jgi:transcription elongation factor Elf1